MGAHETDAATQQLSQQLEKMNKNLAKLYKNIIEALNNIHNTKYRNSLIEHVNKEFETIMEKGMVVVPLDGFQKGQWDKILDQVDAHNSKLNVQIAQINKQLTELTIKKLNLIQDPAKRAELNALREDLLQQKEAAEKELIHLIRTDSQIITDADSHKKIIDITTKIQQKMGLDFHEMSKDEFNAANNDRFVATINSIDRDAYSKLVTSNLSRDFGFGASINEDGSINVSSRLEDFMNVEADPTTDDMLFLLTYSNIKDTQDFFENKKFDELLDEDIINYNGSEPRVFTSAGNTDKALVVSNKGFGLYKLDTQNGDVKMLPIKMVEKEDNEKYISELYKARLDISRPIEINKETAAKFNPEYSGKEISFADKVNIATKHCLNGPTEDLTSIRPNTINHTQAKYTRDVTKCFTNVFETKLKQKNIERNAEKITNALVVTSLGSALHSIDQESKEKLLALTKEYLTINGSFNKVTLNTEEVKNMLKEIKLNCEQDLSIIKAIDNTDPEQIAKIYSNAMNDTISIVEATKETKDLFMKTSGQVIKEGYQQLEDGTYVSLKQTSKMPHKGYVQIDEDLYARVVKEKTASEITSIISDNDLIAAEQMKYGVLDNEELLNNIEKQVVKVVNKDIDIFLTTEDKLALSGENILKTDVEKLKTTVARAGEVVGENGRQRNEALGEAGSFFNNDEIEPGAR